MHQIMHTRLVSLRTRFCGFSMQAQDWFLYVYRFPYESQTNYPSHSAPGSRSRPPRDAGRTRRASPFPLGTTGARGRGGGRGPAGKRSGRAGRPARRPRRASPCGRRVLQIYLFTVFICLLYLFVRIICPYLFMVLRATGARDSEGPPKGSEPSCPPRGRGQRPACAGV